MEITMRIKINQEAERQLMKDDLEAYGVAVGEIVNGETVRLDPHALVWDPEKGGWFFRSADGLVPLKPGDGRWVLMAATGAEDDCVTNEAHVAKLQKVLTTEMVGHQREIWELEKSRARARASAAQSNAQTAETVSDIADAPLLVVRRFVGDADR